MLVKDEETSALGVVETLNAWLSEQLTVTESDLLEVSVSVDVSEGTSVTEGVKEELAEEPVKLLGVEDIVGNRLPVPVSD